MKTLKMILAAATVTTLGTAAALHAEDDPIKVRQEAMKAIGMHMKVLSDMAKGTTEFDADAANAALAGIAVTSGTIPAVFEANAVDPESDASDAIWENWDDFVTKAEALETASSGASVDSPETLGAAVGAVGGTCGACHKAYKL